MGGAHVFPGGRVDDIDHGPEAAAVVRWSGDPAELPWRAAALRELAEEAGVVPGADGFDPAGTDGAAFYSRLAEAGVVLDADRLAWVSTWITPRGMPRRFDTRFYVIAVAGDERVRTDEREVYDAEWVTPAAALAAADAGRWQVEVPTRAHLEMLAGCPDPAAALALADRRPSHPIEPRLVIDAAGVWSAVLPDVPRPEVPGR